MSPSDLRAVPNLKILLALPGAFTHVPNDTVTKYVARTQVLELTESAQRGLHLRRIRCSNHHSKANQQMEAVTALRRYVSERVALPIQA
jgi:hypothetical protein